MMTQFSGQFGTNARVEGITPAMIARYLASNSNGRLAVSLNRTKTALRMFFKFLTDAGYKAVPGASCW